MTDWLTARIESHAGAVEAQGAAVAAYGRLEVVLTDWAWRAYEAGLWADWEALLHWAGVAARAREAEAREHAGWSTCE